jgi:hypothetical protein
LNAAALRRPPPGRPPTGVATLAALAALAALVASPALAALDPVTDRQVGGVLSNACGDRSQIMIRLYDDTLDIERAGVAVKASKLKSSRSAPPGAPAVPEFAAAVQGQAKGGAVNLTITHGAKGLFARIDGSEAALAPLGAGVVGQVLRHCDPNRNRLPGAPIPLEEQTIGALLKRPGFPAAYRAALGPLAREPWIARGPLRWLRSDCTCCLSACWRPPSSSAPTYCW